MTSNPKAGLHAPIETLRELLGAEFPGAVTLRKQAENIELEIIDENGSARLIPRSKEPADVVRRVPVEAEVPDQDGVTIHVLVHVVEGLLRELEVYRDDSGAVRTEIKAESLTIIVL